MQRAVIFAFSLFVGSEALDHTSKGKDDAVGQCSCECCLTEMQREEADTQAEAWSRLQCAFDAAAADSNGEKKCGNLCRRSSNDTVIATAQAEDMDTQRFCFFECEPKPAQGVNRHRNGEAAPGDGCQPLTKSEAVAVHDSSGDVRNPMETPQVMSHFLVARTETSSGSKVGASLKTIASAQATSAQQPTVAAGPWHSVLSGAAMDQGAEIAKLAKVAEQDAATAAAAFQSISESAGAASGTVATAMRKASEAQQAAEAAAKAETRVREIKERMIKRAKQAAEETIPGVMKKMRETADAKAKTEAYAAAAKMQADWMTEGNDAKAAAMKGYEDAMARAAGTANEYMKQGNDFAAQSMAAQMGAQTAQEQANTFQSLGDMSQAQKMIMQSKVMMNTAVSLNAQAAKSYDTAGKITAGLPGYAEQANAAGYHAELVANPDAPPPGIPLVLAQARAEGRKRRVRGSSI